MPTLKPKQERFCHWFIECGNAALAAKAAGYSPVSARTAGYRLIRTPHVVLRIAELQGELAKTQCRKVDVLLGKLETVYRRAIDDRQFSVAARSVELQAKLAGLAERTERETAGRPSRRKNNGTTEKADVPNKVTSAANSDRELDRSKRDGAGPTVRAK
jgi:phage terminase small subunit